MSLFPSSKKAVTPTSEPPAAEAQAAAVPAASAPEQPREPVDASVVHKQREVSLIHRGLTDEDAVLLAEALQSSSVDAKSRDDRCRTLRLGHNKITEKGGAALASALRGETSVVSTLTLSGNAIGWAAVDIVRDLKVGPTTVRELVLVHKNQEAFVKALTPKATSLRRLILQGCSLTDEHAYAMAFALGTRSSSSGEHAMASALGNTKLELLDMRGNRFSFGAATALLNALKGSTRPQLRIGEVKVGVPRPRGLILSKSQQAADKRAQRQEAQLRKEAKEIAAKAAGRAANSVSAASVALKTGSAYALSLAAESEAVPSKVARSSKVAPAPVASQTLTELVARIKRELEIEPSTTAPTALRKANELMGLQPDGSLPQQAERLLANLGT